MTEPTQNDIDELYDEFCLELCPERRPDHVCPCCSVMDFRVLIKSRSGDHK
jgi:hypothetical protein